MATLITVDTTRFAPWVKKLIRRYRKEMRDSVAVAIDNIRFRASKHIIPNTTGTRNPYKATKKQPSHPSKLTERTGKLIQMLTQDAAPAGSAWTDHGTKSRKLRTDAFQGTVKVSAGFGTAAEQYVGTLRVDVQSGSRLTSDLIAQSYLQGKVRGAVNVAALLAMRFKHETGIRGTKRPFIYPAAREEEFPFRSIIDRKLNELGSIQ